MLQFADENAAKAGQLGVMEALLEALSLHKVNAEFAASVAFALGNICKNGIDQQSSIVYLCVWLSYGDAWLLVLQIIMRSLQKGTLLKGKSVSVCRR